MTRALRENRHLVDYLLLRSSVLAGGGPRGLDRATCSRGDDVPRTIVTNTHLVGDTSGCDEKLRWAAAGKDGAGAPGAMLIGPNSKYEITGVSANIAIQVIHLYLLIRTRIQ